MRNNLLAAFALATLLAATEPGTALGQYREPEFATLRWPSDSLVPLRPFSIGPDTLPCPDCKPPKRPWTAAWQLMTVEFIPWFYTLVITDGEWSKVSPETWIDNLKYPWQWDNNKFNTNQFAHPYHGNLYFNAARTNGYDFWQSAPWALAGSLIWELFGEKWAPSPNDLANTTLGGITLGEMTYRASSLVLDNTATGSGRVWREIGAALINPIRGFNRLTRGETGRVTENPPDWRPTRMHTSADFGYRRFSSSATLNDPDALDQVFVRFSVLYGDQLADLSKTPFSAFRLNGTLATRSENVRTLQELRVRGNLTAKPLSSDDTSRMLALFMTYEYINNPVIDFGAQGFQGGVAATGSDTASALAWYGEAMARVNPVAAIRSDYFVTAEGRDYDYGLAFGARAEGTVGWRRKLTLNLSGGYLWLPVASGFPGNHYIWTLGGEVRGYIRGKLGAGVAYNRLWRHSQYDFELDVDEDMAELRAFLTLSMPRWE
jgi:hypothetical protein